MGFFGKKKQKEEDDVSEEREDNSVAYDNDAELQAVTLDDNNNSPNEEDDYADFASHEHTERLMGPEEENRSFGLNLSAKFLFLVGTVLYLVMAVQDFQWAQSVSRDRASLLESSQEQQQQQLDDDFNLEDFLANLTTSSEEGTKEEETAEVEATTATTKTGGRLLQTNWFATHYWDALPVVIQEQAKLLGYDQESWDNALPVYTDTMFWDELSASQKAAATNVFGYEEDSWNDYVSRYVASLPEEETDAPTAPPADGVTEEEAVDDYYGGAEEEEEVVEEEGTDDYYGTPTEPPEEIPETAAPTTVDEEVSSTDGAFEGTTEDGFGTGNETEVFPPRDGSASMFINTQGGISGNDPHDKIYQILYCIAAVCFILVGILDSQREKLGYHAMMVFAGMFGVLSGGLIRENEYVASICHSLSAHFFLVQALLVIYNRLPVTWDPVVRKVLWVADILFVASAVMNIVLSYLYYNDTDEELSVSMATAALVAAVFWCHTALIYMGVTLFFWKSNQKSEKDMDKFEENSVQNSCSVVPNGDGEMDVVFDGPKQGNF